MTSHEHTTLPVTQRMARLIPQPVDGHSPPSEVVHISSFAVIRQHDGKILLTKRNKPQFTAGKWILPSSLIDYGEDPEGAIKRIVEVQLGSRPEKAKLLQVQSYGGSHWDLCFVYNVTMRGGTFGELSKEIERAEFFLPRDLPEELRADHKEVLESAHLL